jgi:hypothetical protein
VAEYVSSNGQLRAFDDRRWINDPLHRVVRIVINENRNCAATETPATLQADITFINAQIMLVAPEPGGDRFAKRLLRLVGPS